MAFVSLTPEQEERVKAGIRPRWGSAVGVGLLVGALAGGGAFTVANSSVEEPVRENFTIAESQGTAGRVSSEIHDPGEVLNTSDRSRLEEELSTIEIPDVVQQVHFMVFEKNDENVNDTVDKYLREQEPDLIGEDSFADGALFVGVGLDPRQSFVFAGNDVADLLDLRDSDHLDRALEAIKPAVKNGDIPAGLLAGVRDATDMQLLEDIHYDNAKESRNITLGASGGGAGVLGAGGILTIAAIRRRRSKQILTAREEMEYVGQEYASLSQRLDAIDVRAHSLSSEFVNDALRDEWAEVRDRFLNMHEQVSALGNLNQQAEDKEFYDKAADIRRAATATQEVSYAEDNIDKIYRVEHGDHPTRTAELNAIRDDIVEAQVSLKDSSSGMYRELQTLREEAERLLADTHSPQFLEGFTRLLSDYQIVLAQLQKDKAATLDGSKTTELTAPGLTSPDYRVGFGVNNFIPFWTINSWYMSNSAAQSSSSNSGTNTSFSSGFSGAGGSSSF